MLFAEMLTTEILLMDSLSVTSLHSAKKFSRERSAEG